MIETEILVGSLSWRQWFYRRGTSADMEAHNISHHVEILDEKVDEESADE